jgi:hypothetical protein
MNGKSDKNGVKIFMNSIDHMKRAAFQELKEALEAKRISDELVEYLASSLRLILRYAKKIIWTTRLREDRRTSE